MPSSETDILAVPSTISPLSSLTLREAVVAVTTWKSSFASQYTGLNTPAKSATPAISVSFLFAAVSGSAEGSSASISWFVASNEVFVSCDSVFSLVFLLSDPLPQAASESAITAAKRQANAFFFIFFPP